MKCFFKLNLHFTKKKNKSFDSSEYYIMITNKNNIVCIM